MATPAPDRRVTLAPSPQTNLAGTSPPLLRFQTLVCRVSRISMHLQDISGLRYPAAEEALHAADWLRADAAEAAGEQATGGLGVEEFNWALSVSGFLLF